MSILVRSEILKLVVNPLTANARYSRHYTSNLPLPVQIFILKTKNLL